jgi:hypothetical protein
VIPGPARALPGQTPAEALAEAKDYGWEANRSDFKPGNYYGFGGTVDSRPVQGHIARANGMLNLHVGKDSRVETEGLRFTVDAMYVGENVKDADALWRRFIRDFYPTGLAAQILDSPARATLVAKTRPNGESELHRFVITVGTDFAFEMHATEHFTDVSYAEHDPHGQLEYELEIVPKAKLPELLARFHDYNWPQPGPAIIGSSATDLPATPADVRKARLASLSPRRAAVPQEPAATYQGIGIRIEKSTSGQWIVGVVPGGPAARAGLRADDRIVAIDRAPTDPMPQADAVTAIRGPAGTKVVLVVDRSGQPVQTIEVIRGPIEGW